jgi:TonB family protein
MLIFSAANVSAAKKIAAEVFSINNEIVPEIKGNVFGPGLIPLENAKIETIGSLEIIYSDSKGQFVLKNVPVGSEITVSYSGLQSMTSMPINIKTKVVTFSIQPVSILKKTSLDSTLITVKNRNLLLNANNENEVFTAVETNPEFIGGTSAMYKYIANNNKYPEAAQRARIEGRVFVKFIVDKNGNTKDPQILKGLGFGCDQETIRIVNEMPKWNPGIQNGKPVSVYFTMPILFKLEESIEKTDLTNKIKPLVIIDDKEMEAGFDLNSIELYKVESMTVFKDKQALERFGEKGKNGVIVIKLK